MRQKKSLESTAYHEAGHAVAAYLLRQRFRYVTIIEDEDSLGHVMPDRRWKSFRPDIMSFAEARPQAEKEIMILLAGVVAESFLTKRHNWRGAHKDLQHAADMACHLIGDEEEAGAYVNWLRLRIRAQLSIPWHFRAVQTLANALLEKKRIGAKHAREIIKRAIKDYFSEELAKRSKPAA